jgi:hypothetical protein
MADFFLWVSAAEPALGWPEGTFAKMYMDNADALADQTLDSSPVAAAVMKLMANRKRWEGTNQELLRELSAGGGIRGVAEKMTNGQDTAWPRTGRGMGTALKRVAPVLRKRGINAKLPRKGSVRRGALVWVIENTGAIGAIQAEGAERTAPDVSNVNTENHGERK